MEQIENPLIPNSTTSHKKLPPPITHYIVIIIFYIILIIIIYTMTSLFILNINKNIFLRIIIGILFYFSLLMTILSHYKSIIIDNTIDYINPINSILNNFCQKCNFERPQRSHHCQICGVCNLKMDHHCPFILNCVGEKNEKHFYLFLLYNFLICLFIFCSTFDYFISTFSYNQFLNNKHYIIIFHSFFISYDNYFTIISFLFSLIIGLFVLFLIYINWLHIKIGMSSIEMKIYQKNLNDCPYYNDNWKENLIKIFGNNIFKMFLPIENDSYQNDILENNYVEIK